MARQLSLLEQQRLSHPEASDADHIARWAADVIAELELEPPIDPAIVASYLGVARVERTELDVAGCLICDRATIVIKIRRHDPYGRQRFTVCHECCHTFFPGYARQTQYRCNPALSDPSARSVEQLCDVGASELLLPRAFITQDAKDVGFTIDGVRELADRYDASLEATGHRIVSIADTPALFLALEVMNKPSDSPGAETKLRVRAARSNGGFPFAPKYKSVSPNTPLHRAYQGEVVHEITDLTEISRDNLVDVEVSARLVPYGNDQIRVLALVRPAAPNRRRQ